MDSARAELTNAVAEYSEELDQEARILKLINHVSCPMWCYKQAVV
jgi:hypothetical protein